MNKISLVFTSIFLPGFCGYAKDVAKQKPNILIIIGDDFTDSDLPLYGGVNVQTPKIDNLAAQKDFQTIKQKLSK